MAMAASRIAPVMICCQKLETPEIERPFWSVAEEQHADRRAADAADAAGEARAAEQHGRRRVEQHGLADQRAGGADPRGLDHAAERGAACPRSRRRR